MELDQAGTQVPQWQMRVPTVMGGVGAILRPLAEYSGEGQQPSCWGPATGRVEPATALTGRPHVLLTPQSQ